MRPDRVFVCGSSPVPHPVTDRLLAGGVPTRPSGEAGPLADYRLIVVDARLAGDDLAPNGIAQRALEAGVAVLVVAPAEGQLAPLAAVLGGVSRSPLQAVFIAPAKNAERRFEAKALGYPGMGQAEPRQKQPKQAARRKRSPVDSRSGDGALSRFISHIEHRLEHGYQFTARAQFPAGLKWFYTTWSQDHDFTFSTSGEETFTNGTGRFSFDYEIWAFLSQSAESEQTYIVTEGTYTVSPGALDENDEEARAVMLFKAKSGTRPTPAGMQSTDHIPQSGVDSWSESFTLNISYLDPYGDYSIFKWDASVNQAISKWSVVNASDGTMQGSTWYVNSPVNGYTFPEDENDAFTGAGHVEPFPETCMQTLALQDASAWRTDGRFSGSLLFETNAQATGWSCYGTNCGLTICYDPDANGQTWTFYPWFDVIVNMT